MIHNKRTLFIRKNDEIKIHHMEANYERGLSADILEHGSANDFGTRLKIHAPTKIVVKKDKFTCGEINIQFAKAIYYKEVVSDISEYTHLVVDINGNIEVVEADNYIDVIKGETIRIIDTVPPIKNKPNFRLNLYGFVPNNKSKKGDDINHYINTANDLMRRFSKNGQGKIYEIRLASGGNIVSTFHLRLVPPQLDYVTIRSKNKSFRVQDGETITFNKNDQIVIEGVHTNLRNNRGIKVNFKGFVGAGDGEDRQRNIALNHTLLKRYSIDNSGEVYPITITIDGSVFGKVFVRIR